jgi:hypothetical protein
VSNNYCLFALYAYGKSILTIPSELVGEEIWTDAVVQWPDYSVAHTPGSIETMILVYSYFNGVYAKADGQVSQGRPIYVEQNKYDRKPFTETGWLDKFDHIVPAEIKYCGGHWIFTHKFIRKSLRQEASRILLLISYQQPL